MIPVPQCRAIDQHDVLLPRYIAATLLFTNMIQIKAYRYLSHFPHAVANVFKRRTL